MGTTVLAPVDGPTRALSDRQGAALGNRCPDVFPRNAGAPSRRTAAHWGSGCLGPAEPADQPGAPRAARRGVRDRLGGLRGRGFAAVSDRECGPRQLGLRHRGAGPLEDRDRAARTAPSTWA